MANVVLVFVSLSVAVAENWKHCFKHKRWRGPSARNCVKLIEDVCDLKAEDQELWFRGLNLRRVWSTLPGSGRTPKSWRLAPLTANASCPTCLDWTTPRMRRPRWLWRSIWRKLRRKELEVTWFQCLQIPWCGTFWKPTSPNTRFQQFQNQHSRGQSQTPELQRRVC